VPRAVRRIPYAAGRVGNVPPSVQHELDEANGGAQQAAAVRLRRMYPSRCIGALGAYFIDANVSSPDLGQVPHCDVDSLLSDLCRLPRPMAETLPTGRDLVAKSEEGLGVNPLSLGCQMELDSRHIQLSPSRVAKFVASGGSLEIRQFDRTCLEWAGVADDVARLSKADVYLKLFLAGGSRSVNGRHHDATDVLATTLFGSKVFEIWTDPLPPEGLPSRSGTVECGGAAMVPRGADHRVTPKGETSALLSAGLMRIGDWIYRGAIPAHLGWKSYPTSAVDYALSLRSHLPNAPWRPGHGQGGSLESRSVGGLHVNHVVGDDVTWSACGATYTMGSDLWHWLLRVHRDGQVPIKELNALNDMSLQGLRFLSEEGVVAHVNDV